TKTHIYVINNLPPNTAPLDIHCASKDDDLGNHTLTLNQYFNFQFCDNPFATMFFCHLWWGNKDKAFEVINAELRKRLKTGNRQLAWIAKGDGIYVSNSFPPADPLEKMYDW
ncbi:hypothetical protein PHJA_000429400, partial [Phtheirospermum japonicum]